MESVARKKQIRKWKRKKRVLIAYAARTAAVLVVTIFLGLLICGCMYLVEHLFKKDVVYGGESEITIEGEDIYYEWQAENEAKDLPLTTAGNSKVIVVDAGHGGKDEGTSWGELKEKDIVLSMALTLKQELEARGVTVIMTRQDDVYLTLEERTCLANDTNADLYVSIHADYFEEDASIQGLTCHYMQGSLSGENYAAKLTDAVEQSGVTSVRKEIASDFYVLRNTSMPALLIETGYLSNATDRTNLSNEQFRKKIMKSVADGLITL